MELKGTFCMRTSDSGVQSLLVNALNRGKVPRPSLFSPRVFPCTLSKRVDLMGLEPHVGDLRLNRTLLIETPIRQNIETRLWVDGLSNLIYVRIKCLKERVWNAT